MGKVVWSRIRKVDSDRMRVTLRVTRSVRMTIEGQIKVLRGASIPSRPTLILYVQAGNLSINTLEASVAETPFGGVKDSGYGREGGAEGLSHYMIVKNLSHNTQW